MVTGNDAADQIVRYTLEGTEVLLKLTGLGAKNAAMFLAALMKDQKKTRGKTTVSRMLREGKPLKFFSVPTDQLRQFAKEAKKYGLLFVAMKHRGSKETDTDIMVFAQDAAKVNRIMDRLKLAHIDPDVVEAEILRDREAPINFTEQERGFPFESFSRSSNGSQLALPSTDAPDRLGLPEPTYPIIIPNAPPEILALPERTDNIIIQPPPRGVLMLPAPDEPESVRERLEQIKTAQAAARKAAEAKRLQFPRKQMKRPKKKVKER